MQNVEMNVSKDGKTLTIKVDLTKDYGESKSGKSIVVASTQGNQPVDANQTKVGLNVFRPVKS